MPMMAMVCAGAVAAWPSVLNPYCVATPTGVGDPPAAGVVAQLAGHGAAGLMGLEGAEAAVRPLAVTLTTIV
jgi:hypothetical protein